MGEEFSPIRHGAKRGLPLGLFIATVMLLILLSSRIPLLGLIGFVGALAVPVIAYKAERESLTQTEGKVSLSGVWLTGVMTFVCGALVCGVILTTYLKWIDPTFIPDMLNEAIRAFTASGNAELQLMADNVKLLIDSGQVPTGTEFAASIMWVIVFTGLVFSGICAVILKSIRAGKPRKSPGM